MQANKTLRESSGSAPGSQSDHDAKIKMQIEIDHLKTENEQLQKSLEQTQIDQKLILAQSTKHIEEFYEKNGKLEEQLKSLSEKHKEELKLKDTKISESKKEYEELEKKFKELQNQKTYGFSL